MACRICSDDDKKENTVSPCNCAGSIAHVHVSCLKHWLWVSKSRSCEICGYSFKTIERLTKTNKEKINYTGICQDFAFMVIAISIWYLMLMVCGMKAVKYFQKTRDKDAFYKGFLMLIVTLAMTLILWIWLIIFSSIWKRLTMVIRSTKRCHLNREDDIIIIDV